MDLCALPVRRGQEGRAGPAGTVHGDDGRWCRGVRCAQARRERSDPVPAGPASPAGHLPAAAHPHGERGGAGPPPREDSCHTRWAGWPGEHTRTRCGPTSLQHLRPHLPGQRMADSLAELPGLCGTAIHREPGAGSTARLPAPVDHPDGRGPVGSGALRGPRGVARGPRREVRAGGGAVRATDARPVRDPTVLDHPGGHGPVPGVPRGARGVGVAGRVGRAALAMVSRRGR